MSRVLVIEDDKQLQKVMVRMVRTGGHEVEAVSTGLEALAKLSDTIYDIVISDYDLEGPLTGEDVYHWVKANLPSLRHKYIFCSANDKSALLCKVSGLVYLEKPASTRAIMMAIEDLSRGSS